MRLAAGLALLAALLPLPHSASVPGPAPAASSSAGSSAAAQPDTEVCVVSDPRAIELSGLVATTQGYIAVIDSQFDTSTVRIIYLNPDCGVRTTVGYPTAARDPEDIAVAPDGRLWVADIGDNITATTHRTTVALWLVPANGGPPVIHRLSYPDGPHDAEALLFDGDGEPVIVTKEISGTAGLYKATKALEANSAVGVPTAKVGEFRPTATGVPNQLGQLGESLVTGAATSPDRHRIALRTYTAAYEWDVPDGDVVKAITAGKPRVTALPDEPQGESIAYTVDGTRFLTLSDESGQTTLRSYVPSTSTGPATTPAQTSAAPTSAGAAPSNAITWFAAAAAIFGLVVLAVGFFGLFRSRAGKNGARG